ncbi:MAG: hypothetical protein Q7K33_01040 [Candidatus Berkelbacteria bacterium]|nr:hypothetical protein [Candidatus Berkelbacteria bacterium]
MIYLIGGPPRCGKTILAKRLSNKVGVSWISADTLESIAKQYVPEVDQARLYPKNVLRNKTARSNDQMYLQFTTSEILDAYITQSKSTWKAVATLVECMVKDDEDLIIEGHQIHPELIDELVTSAKQIRSIVLIKNKVTDIVETARASQEKNDWFLKRTVDPNIHLKIAEMIAGYSKYYQSEAVKYNLPVVEYKGDFENQITVALNSLLGGV